jgi:CRP/FNR family transcriptional regulator, anaerobic regulatory protein
MKEILEYLSKTYWLLAEDASHYILNCCDEITLKKKGILLKEGETCEHIWFVKAGLLRSSSVNEKGQDFSNWFMRENDIATSVVSFFLIRPSEETVEALEDCVIFKMSRKDLFKGLSKYSSMLMATLLITIKYYCQTRLIESFLRKKQPRKIYDYLLSEHAELAQRVPEKHLASFMGVSGPTYTKIKSPKKKEAPAPVKKKKKLKG